MRVTVINPDKAIGVDGEFYSGLTFGLSDDIHAIQWYGTWGEVEYALTLVDGQPFKPENKSITDFTPYEHLIAVWQQAKTEFELEIALRAEEARLAAEAESARLAAELEAMRLSAEAAQTQGNPTP